jgi:hypothetical protein
MDDALAIAEPFDQANTKNDVIEGRLQVIPPIGGSDGSSLRCLFTENYDLTRLGRPNVSIYAQPYSAVGSEISA